MSKALSGKVLLFSVWLNLSLTFRMIDSPEPSAAHALITSLEEGGLARNSRLLGSRGSLDQLEW